MNRLFGAKLATPGDGPTGLGVPNGTAAVAAGGAPAPTGVRASGVRAVLN